VADKNTQKKTWRSARGEGQHCSVEGCKRPYRAKGYCFFHYKKWRQGELPHSRYKSCSKAECKKPSFRAGMCEKHYNETYKTAEAAA
jgi:hypothetical protein